LGVLDFFAPIMFPKFPRVPQHLPNGSSLFPISFALNFYS
jgi:hypothetical protein